MKRYEISLHIDFSLDLPQKSLLENKLRELRELAEAEGLVDEEEIGDGEV